MTASLLNLSGRNVLVTGASSGLGRAVATLAASLGARVVLLARDSGRLAETARLLSGSGHECLAFDLQETDKIPDLVSDLAARLSPLAGVVHCAGIAQTKPFAVTPPADYEVAYRIHVVAPSQLLRGLTRRGASAPDGCSVVIVGSVMSCVGTPGRGAYCSAKAGVLGLVRSAAVELARYRIRVNAILPGYFTSEMTQKLETKLTPEQVAQIEKMHPLGIGRSEDVAAAAMFLVADTGRWITGTGLVVDGGYTAQ